MKALTKSLTFEEFGKDHMIEMGLVEWVVRSSRGGLCINFCCVIPSKV